MRLLVIGGTRFLGRHLVDLALRANHSVTLFNRGVSNPELFPEAEHLRGDRDGDLDRLGRRDWDAVVDTCGYVPRLVEASARRLAGRCAQYTFVSSISVYREFRAGMGEDGPLCDLDDPSGEEITGETYGGLKVACERAAEAAMPGRVLQVRAGLIVGPHDPTDRFTYWVRRVAVGGRTLVPGPRERPLQFIHAGDLAAWILAMAQRSRAGTFNATGPPQPHTMEELIAACAEAGGNAVDPIWIEDRKLFEAGIAPWTELPLVTEPDEIDICRMDVGRAFAEGLSVRPLLRTVRETLAWDMSRPPGTRMATGMAPAKEVSLLATLTRAD
jgi:2'-hydroxyisoflavone reductase